MNYQKRVKELEKKLAFLEMQLNHEQKTAIQWINLYKDTHPHDVSFWQGYLKCINKFLELDNIRIKK